MRAYVYGEESGMRKGKLETYGSKTSENKWTYCKTCRRGYIRVVFSHLCTFTAFSLLSFLLSFSTYIYFSG